MSRAVKRPIAMFVDQSDTASIQASVDAGVSAYIVGNLQKERIKTILDLCISRFNAFARLQDELDRAKSALEERKVIDRAKGILMKAKNLTEEAGLRAAAQDRDEREQEDRRGGAVGDHGGGAVQMTEAAHRIHSARRRDRAAGRGRQGLLRGRRARCRAGARSVVVEHARQAQHRPVRRRASDRAGRDRVEPGPRPHQGADRRAVRARRERQRHHGLARAARGARRSGRGRHPRSDGVGARRSRAWSRQRKATRRRAAHLRHDVPVLDAQLSSALLDGGGRRRSGRGRAARRAAAALHGGEPAEQAMSMRSASARRGIRSRSISASATSCISSRRSSRAPPRSCSACASAGPTRTPMC